ncbi:LysR family transcriptional regulator [Pantoea sp. BAV 3049]|uniref:LysR family transcriptional regulator n=1 Tax=Pantoea sp. BAV 3049 TaxID=2654188 RepID=UPI00131E55F4|nr:LysR family transcriptional regulator [Pantoea sp. BAV 3049]
MNDLNVLKIFIAAAEAGNFALAARKLGLTRSAVAKAIGRLEERTGTRLFHRTTRVITLTDEGRTLCQRCTVTIAELEEAIQAMSSRGNEPQGLLRMSIPDAYGRRQVMPVLARYLAAWPRVEAEVSFSDRTVDLITEGYDLAIRIGAQNISEDLVSRVVDRQRLSICASPDYLRRNGIPRTPDELKKHAGLLFVQHGRTLAWRLSDENGKSSRLEPVSRVRFDDGEALRDAAVAGLGIVQLPDFLAEQEAEKGRLVRIMEKYEPERIPIVVLYPTRKYLAPRVRLFIDSLFEGTH